MPETGVISSNSMERSRITGGNFEISRYRGTSTAASPATSSSKRTGARGRSYFRCHCGCSSPSQPMAVPPKMTLAARPGSSRSVGQTADAEGLVVAGERSCWIARILFPRKAQEAAGGLKNAHAVDLARQVETQVSHQTSHETRAHHIELGCNRIFQGDRLGVAAEIALPLRLNEAEIHDLEVLAVHQDPLELGEGPAALRSGEHGERRPWRTRWNIVVAVQPCDFFDHVLFDLEVETVRRRGYRKFTGRARIRQLQTLEQGRDLLFRELHADDLARAARAQPDRLALRQRCRSFAHGSRRAAADVKYQLRGALDCLRGGRKIHAALEAES